MSNDERNPKSPPTSDSGAASEGRSPTRCDGATARREEIRNPKSENRRNRQSRRILAYAFGLCFLPLTSAFWLRTSSFVIYRQSSGHAAAQQPKLAESLNQPFEFLGR